MMLDRHRIVEPDHQPVTREVLERAPVAHDLLAHRGLVRAEQRERFLRLGCLTERGVPTEVAEHDSDLATMAGEKRIAFGGRHKLGDLRRKEPR